MSSTLSYEDRLVLEESVTQSPYDVLKWCDYLSALSESSFRVRSRIYERALKNLPGSYKLWFKYITERKRRVRGLRLTHARYEKANQTFERALVYLHKMPRIWIDFCEFLLSQRLYTRARHALNDALKALPVTQHERIWAVYVRFASARIGKGKGKGKDEEMAPPGKWAVGIFKRYLMFDPSKVEEFLEYLLKSKMFARAAEVYADILQREGFASIHGKTNHQLWMELCDLLSEHAEDVIDARLDVESVLRSGLKRFSDETGKLWCCIADYYIRVGQFEKARGIYEEALVAVLTVRDFSTVFDAYTQFQEALLSAKIEAHGGEDEAEEKGKADDPEYYRICVDDGADGSNHVNDVDLLLSRLEHLLNRRPLLLNSVMLRQNPNNVEEWHKRAKIYEDAGDLAKVVTTYTDAVKAVVPAKSAGKAQSLWIALAKFYEKHNDESNEGLQNACEVFERAVKVPFRRVEHLAQVYCSWVEMELRHRRYDKAREIIQEAVTPPSQRERIDRKTEQRQLLVQGRIEESKELGKETQAAVFTRLHRSTKLWALYIDLEESFGTLKTARAAYERMLNLKVATPETVLNYASLLDEHKYFEESFRCFEKGVSLFPWPHCNELWLVYLRKFVDRYGEEKLDRGRELFESALSEVPPDLCKPFFLLFADLEERFGLTKRAMEVYERLCDNAPEDERLDMYLLYIDKVTEYYGLAATRQVYERGIEKLADLQVKDLSIYYCSMERNLGEIDRARAILRHGSQFADPKVSLKYWKFWHEFEVAHGNEDTFREMLRIKRSVAAQYANDVSYGFIKEDEEKKGGDDMEVDATTAKEDNKQEEDEEKHKRKAAEAEVEEERIKKKVTPSDSNLEIDLEQQSVPATVFGDAIEKAKEEAKLGALDRFKQG